MKKIQIIILGTLFSIFIFAGNSLLLAENTDDMITIKGVFTDITRPNVTFKTDEGIEYLIHIGPVWYWEDNNYVLSLNSTAEIYGKLEPGKNEIYAYTVKIDEKIIKLVDDKGNPLWWNDGKGRNRGNDWGLNYGRSSRCTWWNK